MNRLGGWWRLWIFASGLWLVFSVVIGFSTWPNQRPTVTEEEQKKLTPQSQALLYHHGMPWERRYTVPAPDDLPSKPGRGLFIDKPGPGDPYAAFSEPVAPTEGEVRPTLDELVAQHNPPKPTSLKDARKNPNKPALKQEKQVAALPDDLFDPVSIGLNDGTTLSLKNSATPEQLNSFLADYTRVQDRKLMWERVRFLGLVFMLWVLPCLFVMGLGLAIRWVFRGFKKAEV